MEQDNSIIILKLYQVPKVEHFRKDVSKMVQKIKSDSGIRIGENISCLRQKKAMTQEDMARELQLLGFSISRSTYAKMEMGTHTMEASVLEAVRDILDTTYDELLKRT